MRQRRRDERLVEHVLRCREARLDVAERPLDAGRAHRQLPRRPRRSRAAVHLIGLHALLRDDVAVGARIGSAGKQALRADR